MCDPALSLVSTRPPHRHPQCVRQRRQRRTRRHHVERGSSGKQTKHRHPSHTHRPQQLALGLALALLHTTGCRLTLPGSPTARVTAASIGQRVALHTNVAPAHYPLHHQHHKPHATHRKHPPPGSPSVEPHVSNSHRRRYRTRQQHRQRHHKNRTHARPLAVAAGCAVPPSRIATEHVRQQHCAQHLPLHVSRSGRVASQSHTMRERAPHPQYDVLRDGWYPVRQAHGGVTALHPSHPA